MTSSSRTAALTQLRQRADRARAWLFDCALPLWWPRGYDQVADCFHERIALDGTPVFALPRRVRVQARQTAVYAGAGKLGWDGPWREAVDTGVRILRIRGLRADGGARHLLGPDGAPLDDRRDLYDLAFVIFAFAEAATALNQRPDLIADAEQLADWAETHWAHPKGGYREGDVAPALPRRQNPHMHLFEALLALYEASGKREHLDRASRIANLLRNKLFDARHAALPENFNDDWSRLAGENGDICEPGHYFEWSWLLHRFHALGGGDVRDIAERLRTQAETHGVDPHSGAVYDALFLDGRARARASRLWPHTERLKANLVCFEHTGDAAAAQSAISAFDTLMRYCDTPLQGLWRDRLDADGRFIDEAAPASSFYHITLALSELMRVAAAE